MSSTFTHHGWPSFEQWQAHIARQSNCYITSRDDNDFATWTVGLWIEANYWWYVDTQELVERADKGERYDDGDVIAGELRQWAIDNMPGQVFTRAIIDACDWSAIYDSISGWVENEGAGDDPAPYFDWELDAWVKGEKVVVDWRGGESL